MRASKTTEVDKKSMKTMKIGVGAILVGLLLNTFFGLAPNAHAQASVTLEWDASPDPTVTGYALYYSAVGSSVPIRQDVGLALTVTVSNLVVGVTYSFYVVAYNAYAVESDPSNVLFYTVLAPPAILKITWPVSFDYGVVTVGQSSNKTFQVVNIGGSNLVGTASATLPFAVTSGGSFNLSPGATGLVVVAFSPVIDGLTNGTVIFQSNGGNATNTLTGTGITLGKLAVGQSSLNFGTVAVGASANLTFTVTNQGGTTITGGSAIVSSPWSIVSGSPFTLNGFTAKTITVKFSPTTVGNFTNIVSLASANGGSTNLTVIGLGAVLPIASFTADKTNGTSPLVVTFTDKSSGTITNRLWNFGDGSAPESGTNVVHTFAATGVASTNTVQLIISGPLGSATNTLKIVTLPKPAGPGGLQLGNLSIYWIN